MKAIDLTQGQRQIISQKCSPSILQGLLAFSTDRKRNT